MPEVRILSQESANSIKNEQEPSLAIEFQHVVGIKEDIVLGGKRSKTGVHEPSRLVITSCCQYSRNLEQLVQVVGVLSCHQRVENSCAKQRFVSRALDQVDQIVTAWPLDLRIVGNLTEMQARVKQAIAKWRRVIVIQVDDDTPKAEPEDASEFSLIQSALLSLPVVVVIRNIAA